MVTEKRRVLLQNGVMPSRQEGCQETEDDRVKGFMAGQPPVAVPSVAPGWGGGARRGIKTTTSNH